MLQETSYQTAKKAANLPFIIWGILMVCLMPRLSAQTIQVATHQEPIPISSKVQYLLTEEAFSIEQVQSLADTSWEKYDKKHFTLRASPEQLWFKITAQNLSEEDIWLEVGRNLASWEIDFYAPDTLGGYMPPIQTGSMRPAANKAYPSNFYWLPLAKRGDSQSHTYYVNIRTPLTKEFPLHIGSLSALTKVEKQNEYLSIAFLSVVFAMFFYNLFLLFSTKDQLYLRYVLYLLVVGFMFTFINGFPLIDRPFLYTYYIVVNNVGQLGIVTFILGYLRLKQLTPKFYKVLWVFLFLLIVGTFVLNILGFPLGKVSSAYNLLSMVLAAIWMSTGSYLWIKGHRHARFFMLGWISAAIALFVTILTIYGVVPRNLFTRNAFYIGFGIEAVVFSLALADRLNTMQKEKRKVEQENLRLVNDQKRVLEEKVLERTNEIEAQKQEIITQNEELQQQQEEVIAQRDFIERQNEQLHYHNLRITDSIRYAQTIQEAVLPSDEKMKQQLNDYFVFFKPKDIVSGDFYWVLEAHDSTYLAVGDCTGHGVPGAFMSIIGLSLLSEIILGNEAASPKDILLKLDEKVTSSLRQKQTENRDGMDISICQLFPKEEHTELIFAGAKTSLYYQKPNEQKVQRAKGDRKSVGGAFRPNNSGQSFQNTSLTLPKGTMLYLATDGLADQCNAEGRKLGSPALRAFLAQHSQSPLAEQKKQLEELLQEYTKDGAVQRDDITVVGVKL